MNSALCSSAVNFSAIEFHQTTYIGDIFMFRILVTEDDKNSARLMQIILTKAGYSVLMAKNGVEALEVLDREHVDLILLDVMMPEMDGFTFTQTVRSNNIDIPILIISAKQLPEDKCEGFLAGADDYMTSEQKLTIGAVTLDYSSLSVTRGSEHHTLPKKEFYLLFKLLSCPDKIFTRIQLMDEIWGMNSNSVDTTINVHINRLRKRFGEYPEFRIVAIKGIGYKAVINQ